MKACGEKKKEEGKKSQNFGQFISTNFGLNCD